MQHSDRAQPQAHIKYRPEIDGLRAIAVLAVVIYHAIPNALSGGFIGVDIFFVISGYLISGILFKQAINGGIQFFDFYRRRVNRILPSLITVFFFCLAVGWIELFPKEFHQLGSDVASGASFSANFSLMGESGYFDRSAAIKPLLHIWSLAIEEQFYVVWPLLIGLSWRLCGRWMAVLIAFTACSLGFNLFEAAHDNVVDFFSPLTRFWELSAGAIIAAHMLNKQTLVRDQVANWLSVIGLLALLVSFFVLSNTNYPGIQALLPVIGAALIIASGSHAWINRYVLAQQPLRWIGTISYPLYLWHWPLLSFLRILEGQTPPLSLRIAAVALAFIFAIATHHFIENPMRMGSYPKRKMLAALGGILLAAALGQYIFLRQGLPYRAVVQLNPIYASANAGGPGSNVRGQCYLQPNAQPHVDGCSMDSREAPVFALIGDSKSGALAPGIFRTSQAHGRWLYMGNNDGKGKYMSTTLLSQTSYPREYPLTRQMLDTIEAHKAIRSVVIANAIRNLFGLKDETSIADLAKSHDDQSVFMAFNNAISELIATKHNVYIVVDKPTLAHPEDCGGRITSLPILNRLLNLPAHPNNCSIAYSRYIELSSKYRMLLNRLHQSHPLSLRIIETADIFCDMRTDTCPMIRDGHMLYGYTDHPSDYASGIIGARIKKLLMQTLPPK